MRRLMTIIAAVAAMAATSVALAATPASAATVFCKNEGFETGGKCAVADIQPIGTHFSSAVSYAIEGTKFSLKGSILYDMKCTSVLMEGKNTAEVKTPLPGQAENYVSPSSCSFNGSKYECTAAAMNSPTVNYAPTTGGSGTMTTTQPLVISYTCKNPFSEEVKGCSYTASSVPFQINRGETNLVTVKEVTMTLKETTSGTCAATANLNITARMENGAPYILPAVL